MGLVAYQGKWNAPEQVSQAVQERPGTQGEDSRNISSAAPRRADRAEDQWKLALWCEQNDLKEQATAHVFRVLQLDPSRDAAWKHLGYKRLGGHWDKPERVAAAKAEAQQQHKRNKHWRPLLEKWRAAQISRDKARREQAEKSLAERDRSPGGSDDLGRLREWRTAAPEDGGEAARPDRFTGFVAGPRDFWPS